MTTTTHAPEIQPAAESTTAAPAPAATSETTDRPVASLGELQRAWQAVQAGRFRTNARPTAGYAPTDAPAAGSASTTAGEWFPAETVVPVIGAGGNLGATTLALALSSASTETARVVECCSSSASGLASASTAELGPTGDGWRRGLREGLHHRILLERAAAPITTAAAVPLPTDPDRPVAITFLDCGWDLDNLLADGWLAETVTTAPALVVAATATVPGMRRLEITLEALGTTQARVAVLGPRRKKWGRPVEGSIGPATRALDAAGGLIEIPLDRGLGLHGLTVEPLPQPLMAAAGRLLEQLPTPAGPANSAGFDPGYGDPYADVDHEPLAVDDDQDS